jgi:hypothetical protein
VKQDGRATVATVTLLYGMRPPFGVAASPEGERLWLSADALPAATGWELKPEGLCQDDVCVPVPGGVSLVRENHPTTLGRRDQVDLTVLAGLLGQAVVRDEAHAVWCFGDAAPARRAAMQSLQAPDFTLPDLEGRSHALRDYRGKKVFLVSWASW